MAKEKPKEQPEESRELKENKEIEALISQVGDILTLAKRHEGKVVSGDVTPELEQQVENLKRNMELFIQINEKMFEEAGVHIDSEEIAPPMPAHLSKKEKALYEKATRMRIDAMVMQAKLEEATGVSKKKGTKGKKGKKSKEKERQKKFKALGSKEGWMPL